MYLKFVLISYGHAGIQRKNDYHEGRNSEILRNRKHDMPHNTTWRSTWVGQEVVGTKGEHGPKPLFCSLREVMEGAEYARVDKFRIR